MPVDLLRDGLVQARAPAAPSEPAAEPKLEPATATPLGTCDVCGERPATARCLNCEEPVCAADLWIMFGLCRRCLTEDEVRAARERKASARPDLGIKWIED